MDVKEDAGWGTLSDELDAWGNAGRRARFWWRDDDAGGPTAALDRLLRLSTEVGAPLALAVIPKRLRPGIGAQVAAAPGVRVVQHGYAHINHAAGTNRDGACELCLERGLEVIGAELADGLRLLEAAFPGRVAPVLVPPWNRIDPGVAAALPAMGYRGLSTFGPREASPVVPGLTQVNAHCDPVKWKRGGRFAGLSACLGAIVGQLRRARKEAVAEAPAVGLLSHHLDFDEEAWAFTESLVALVNAHPNATFAAVDALFPTV
ncbi:MAG: polysaccharide deacetylase family protein [Alphaproteobacteria bacterium]|nr:polysaccharide deacetylase family protein [Alphaproteobacteria bacterium]